MSEPPKLETSPGSARPFVAPNMAETFSMRALFDEQKELADETRKIMARWTRRRQEAVESSLQTLRTIATCGDPNVVVEACHEWLADSTSRMRADLDDAHAEATQWAEMGRKCAMALFPHGASQADGTGPSPSAPSSP